MALEHIEVYGKLHPYLLSYRALKKISQAQGVGSITNIESLEHAAYWALYSGHFKEKPTEPFEIKLENMEVLLDDNLELFLKVTRDVHELTEKMQGGKEGNPTAPIIGA